MRLSTEQERDRHLYHVHRKRYVLGEPLLLSEATLIEVLDQPGAPEAGQAIPESEEERCRWLYLFCLRIAEAEYVEAAWQRRAGFVGYIKKGPSPPIDPKRIATFASSALIAERFRLLFLPTGVIHVTTANRSRRNSMSENAIESENTGKPAPEAAKPKGARKSTKKAKPAKKAGRAKKTVAKPKADRANKKAEVIAMMKRAKGATLAEIMKATGWQAHTVRGFVSILGSKGGEKIESSKNAAGERTYKIGK